MIICADLPLLCSRNYKNCVLCNIQTIKLQVTKLHTMSYCNFVEKLQSNTFNLVANQLCHLWNDNFPHYDWTLNASCRVVCGIITVNDYRFRFRTLHKKFCSEKEIDMVCDEFFFTYAISCNIKPAVDLKGMFARSRFVA